MLWIFIGLLLGIGVSLAFSFYHLIKGDTTQHKVATGLKWRVILSALLLLIIVSWQLYQHLL